MDQKKFYITTPIYYPSDKLHIGHTYCTVATDAMARYKRLQGYNVKFLTGTDEHGQKIELKAKEAGVTPQQFVDNIVEGPKGVKDLWKLMNISYDRFIRTTDDYHVAAIQKIFKKMYEKGDIYKGTYKGKYCTPCESFWTESQLVNGCCPDCGRPVVDAEEEAYFFRLSKYADRVRDLLVNTDFLLPRSRVNEMVHNFIDPGLEDLCVSRTSFKWGIPVDFDPKHVVYVWIDALFNYTTALGFMNDKYPDSDYETFWPADVHFIGKEIVRFHSIIWPAMLMSMDMPLPKHVYGHGWLLLDGGKMSKSKGNVVDPYLLAERYSADALRYFLLRDFPFGSDGNFSNELLINRINMDLANDLGNLLSRTTAMADKYFGGCLPIEQDEGAEDAALLEKLQAVAEFLREAEGWEWCAGRMEPVGECREDAGTYRCLPEPEAVLTEAEEERLNELMTRYDALENQCEESDLLEAEMKLIDCMAKVRAWTPEMRAGSGVVVSWRYGNVCVQRGVQLRSEDDVADDADRTEQVQEKASVEEISLPLLTKMSSERTLAVQAALMQQPDKSLTLLAWTLCLNVFGSGAYSKPAQISLECKHYSLTSDAPSGKEGAAFMALMAEKARLAALLPEGWSRDMTTFLSLSQEVLLSLLSFCTACSLNGVQTRECGHTSRSPLDTLETAIGFHMRDWWQPTKANFFGHLKKPQIIAALNDAGLSGAARDAEKMKKGDAAEHAEHHMKDNRWVPGWMCAPHPQTDTTERTDNLADAA